MKEQLGLGRDLSSQLSLRSAPRSTLRSASSSCSYLHGPRGAASSRVLLCCGHCVRSFWKACSVRLSSLNSASELHPSRNFTVSVLQGIYRQLHFLAQDTMTRTRRIFGVARLDSAESLSDGEGLLFLFLALLLLLERTGPTSSSCFAGLPNPTAFASFAMLLAS